MIFESENYRDILSNEIVRRTERNSAYSANSFAKNIEISQSFLSLVLNGKRSLSLKQSRKICEKLKYNQVESKYFELLVCLDGAKDDELKNYYRNKISQIKYHSRLVHLSEEVKGRLNDGYDLAILEILDFPNQKQVLDRFAKSKGISQEQLKHSLEKLEQLGLIENESGQFKRIDKGYLPIGQFQGEETELLLAIDPQNLVQAREMIQEFIQNLSVYLRGESPKDIALFKIGLNHLDESSSLDADEMH